MEMRTLTKRERGSSPVEFKKGVGGGEEIKYEERVEMDKEGGDGVKRRRRCHQDRTHLCASFFLLSFLRFPQLDGSSKLTCPRRLVGELGGRRRRRGRLGDDDAAAAVARAIRRRRQRFSCSPLLRLLLPLWSR